MKLDQTNEVLKSDTVSSESNDTLTGVGKFLRRKARVTEEQLFGAALAERLERDVGEAESKAFEKAFRQEKSKLRSETGKRQVEQSALNALTQLSEGGIISESERNKVFDEAFRIAQLDDDDTSLEDANDPGKAVTTRDQAIKSADEKAATLSSLSVEEQRPFTGLATAVEAEIKYLDDVDLKGFLWKPMSESDGKLVTLMPPSLTGRISQVNVVDQNGNVLDTGRYSGNANGGRDHYRFNLSGADFTEDVILEINLNTDEIVRLNIDSPQERFEK